ncbi:hypothetical protein BASA81_002229 [Batrachochytrium salamandrivorans]|nr:hypothetical protein BASA81_002229 [Batrachochytrium salamandrivorans]
MKYLVLIAVLPLLLAWLFPGQVLKLQVAKELLGWDGLFSTAREQIGLRLLGARETKSRRELHKLLDLVSKADLEYCVPTRRVVDESDIAECHRFLTHLLKSGLRNYYEMDLDFPHLEPFVEPRTKVLGDNPDALYFGATFSSNHSYLLQGELTGEVYFSVTIYENQCVGCFVGRPIADLNFQQLDYNSNKFEIWVARENPHNFTNFLNLTNLGKDMVPQLISRHYFENLVPAQLDATITPKLSLRRVDPSSMTTQRTFPHQIQPLTQSRNDEYSAQQFVYVQNFVRQHSLEMLADPSKAPSWFSFTPNTFGPPVNFKTEAQGAGAVDVVYSAGPFKFTNPEEQGLLVTGMLPDCVFANIALWNKFLQTFAYETGRQVSLNRKQLGSTRSYSILLAKRLPQQGLKNGTVWLDSEGRTDGQMFWRFFLVPPGHKVDTPHVELIPNIDRL